MRQRLLSLIVLALLGLGGGVASAAGQVTARVAAERVTRVTGSTDSHVRRVTRSGRYVIRSRRGAEVRDRYVTGAGRIATTGRDLVPEGLAAVTQHHQQAEPGATGFAVEFAERFEGLTKGRTAPHGTNLRYFVTDGKPYMQGGTLKQKYLYNPETRQVRKDSVRF
jgi:hypothetical protein